MTGPARDRPSREAEQTEHSGRDDAPALTFRLVFDRPDRTAGGREAIPRLVVPGIDYSESLEEEPSDEQEADAAPAAQDFAPQPALPLGLADPQSEPAPASEPPASGGFLASTRALFRRLFTWPRRAPGEPFPESTDTTPPEPETADTIEDAPADEALEDRDQTDGSAETADLAEGAPDDAAKREERKVNFLTDVLEARLGCLVPELNPLAPARHAFPQAEQLLGVPAGESVAVLEELADCGFFRRELHDVVNVCPQCLGSRIHVREFCPDCGSFDLERESLLQHGRCAHAAVESAFATADRLCPKCRQPLGEEGRGFKRHGKMHVCGSCGRVASQAVVRLRCLTCSREFDRDETETLRIYRYVPTSLAMRAVQLRRLTGLDIAAQVRDPKLGLATREFLHLQAHGEVMRLSQGIPFAAAILGFRERGQPAPILGQWRAADLRRLGRAILESTQPPEVVAQLDSGRIAVLFPGMHAPGLAAARSRLTSHLSEHLGRAHPGRAIEVKWTQAVFDNAQATIEAVLGFFDDWSADAPTREPTSAPAPRPAPAPAPAPRARRRAFEPEPVPIPEPEPEPPAAVVEDLPDAPPPTAAARRRKKLPPRIVPAEDPPAPAKKVRELEDEAGALTDDRLPTEDDVVVEALGEEDVLDDEEENMFDDLVDKFDDLVDSTEDEPPAGTKRG